MVETVQCLPDIILMLNNWAWQVALPKLTPLTDSNRQIKIEIFENIEFPSQFSGLFSKGSRKSSEVLKSLKITLRISF